MDAYVSAMSDLGAAEGRTFNLRDGVIANTLQAHRILQWTQETNGPEKARCVLENLYAAYFEQAAHPSSSETLVAALEGAGIGAKEAKKVVDDESEGMMEVKSAIREQVGNAVDSVPYVVFEGRRRDFTLIGAKSVEEYTKTLGQVAKECV